MTPAGMVAQMRDMGVPKTRLDQMGRPSGKAGGHLVIVWAGADVGGLPGTDMPEPLRVCVYAPDSSASAWRWQHTPSESYPGLTADQAVARIAALTALA